MGAYFLQTVDIPLLGGLRPEDVCPFIPLRGQCASTSPVAPRRPTWLCASSQLLAPGFPTHICFPPHCEMMAHAGFPDVSHPAQFPQGSGPAKAQVAPTSIIMLRWLRSMIRVGSAPHTPECRAKSETLRMPSLSGHQLTPTTRISTHKTRRPIGSGCARPSRRCGSGRDEWPAGPATRSPYPFQRSPAVGGGRDENRVQWVGPEAPNLFFCF